MFIEQFIEKLTFHASEFSWYFSDDGEIRAKHRDFNHIFCPLTAVALAEFDEVLYAHQTVKAALALLIEPSDLGHILAASDDIFAEVNLRGNMLRAVGLAEGK